MAEHSAKISIWGNFQHELSNIMRYLPLKLAGISSERINPAALARGSTISLTKCSLSSYAKNNGRKRKHRELLKFKIKHGHSPSMFVRNLYTIYYILYYIYYSIVIILEQNVTIDAERQAAVAQWLRALNIFRQICKSTSEWCGFYHSRFEFAKTPLLILNH